ncbi:hypothetical protein ACFQX4_08010 [Roseomonas sp. GCM10028921]
MSFIGAALDQLGQGLLFQPRRVPVGQPLRPGEGLGQRRRDDEVAEAQGGGSVFETVPRLMTRPA